MKVSPPPTKQKTESKKTKNTRLEDKSRSPKSHTIGDPQTKEGKNKKEQKRQNHY